MALRTTARQIQVHYPRRELSQCQGLSVSVCTQKCNKYRALPLKVKSGVFVEFQLSGVLGWVLVPMMELHKTAELTS